MLRPKCWKGKISMKNKIKVLLMVMLVCAVFGGCSSSKKTEKWLLTKRSSYGEGGELERWGEATYDENGNEVEWKSYDNEGTITYRRECTYDENGNQVIKEYGEQDRLVSEKTYNTDGKILCYTDYSEEGMEISKSISSYDENGNELKCERYSSDKEGRLELDWVGEYEYDESDRKIVCKQYFYNKEGEEIVISFSQESDYVYDNDGKLSIEYLYDLDTGEKQLYLWITHLYNAMGDEIETKSYGADGVLNKILRWEIIYDENGNCIRNRQKDDFDGKILDDREWKYDDNGNIIEEVRYGENGDIYFWFASKYDDNGNIIEEVRYDENGDITSKHENEYVSIQTDESIVEEEVEEKKIVKTSDDEKLKFMKKLYDCMENKMYENISAIISERDTMWTTIYYQDGKLVDKLSDGQALIYSFSSGVYYGQVVNGKRQGQGVQWKDDTERTSDNQPQYYYIDGTWKDNKGNGHCKLYYSTFLSNDEMKNQYVYVEGNYVNSKEDGEMRMTWLTSDGIICSGTYKVIDGIIQNNGEVDEDGIYVWVRDENDSGHYITTTYLEHHDGFPRQVYDQID